MEATKELTHIASSCELWFALLVPLVLLQCHSIWNFSSQCMQFYRSCHKSLVHIVLQMWLTHDVKFELKFDAWILHQCVISSLRTESAKGRRPRKKDGPRPPKNSKPIIMASQCKVVICFYRPFERFLCLVHIFTCPKSKLNWMLFNSCTSSKELCI